VASDWQSTMITLLRSMIFDMTEPYTYTDERLEEILVAAAVPVNSEVTFANTYTVNLNTYDISPDPVSGTSEIAFQVLVCRKAAYMITFGEAKQGMLKSVSFKDGPSSIDTRDSAKGKLELANQAKEDYERARTNYLVGDGMRGKGIVTPFNIGVVDSTVIGR
jgi:hypothetical protein